VIIDAHTGKIVYLFVSRRKTWTDRDLARLVKLLELGHLRRRRIWVPELSEGSPITPSAMKARQAKLKSRQQREERDEQLRAAAAAANVLSPKDVQLLRRHPEVVGANHIGTARVWLAPKRIFIA
jgi:hypothetical protein